MSHVVSVESGSRRSRSNAGRKNGSKRRSAWMKNRQTRAIPLSRLLPVSGGGSPKPGPGSGLSLPDGSAGAMWKV